jgi:hypothetical protein
MKHRTGIIAGAAAAFVAFLPALAESPTGARDASSRIRRIRIEHQLVRIPITTPTAAPFQMRVALEPARASQPSRGRIQSPRPDGAALPALRRGGDDGRSSSLLKRAARTLIGDGRHKPQPFPRPVR